MNYRDCRWVSSDIYKRENELYHPERDGYADTVDLCDTYVYYNWKIRAHHLGARYGDSLCINVIRLLWNRNVVSYNAPSALGHCRVWMWLCGRHYVGDEGTLWRLSLGLVEQDAVKMCGDVEVERHAFFVSVLLQNPLKKPLLPIG